MINTNTGGPAFPFIETPALDIVQYSGMTLRDYFAAKAMQGMMYDASHPAGGVIAEWAYEVADAMLKARQQ